jgi:N-ethylmaleimide reductase
MPAQAGLFTPVRVGPLELPNRIVMSPMTRIRADEGCVPSERMVRYYSQRASAGLIITEATQPRPWDVLTFYSGADHGYTDYPTLAEKA